MVHAMVCHFENVTQLTQAHPDVDDHGNPSGARLLLAVADQVADDGIPSEIRHGQPLARAGAMLVRPWVGRHPTAQPPSDLPVRCRIPIGNI